MHMWVPQLMHATGTAHGVDRWTATTVDLRCDQLAYTACSQAVQQDVHRKSKMAGRRERERGPTVCVVSRHGCAQDGRTTHTDDTSHLCRAPRRVVERVVMHFLRHEPLCPPPSPSERSAKQVEGRGRGHVRAGIATSTRWLERPTATASTGVVSLANLVRRDGGDCRRRDLYHLLPPRRQVLCSIGTSGRVCMGSFHRSRRRWLVRNS